MTDTRDSFEKIAQELRERAETADMVLGRVGQYELKAYAGRIAALQAGAGDDTARIDYLETLRGDVITGTSDDQELVGHDWVIYGQFYTVREALDYGMMKRQEAIDNAQDTERK